MRISNYLYFDLYIPIAAPLENNTLEWHYVIQGPKDTAYSGGWYHGECEIFSVVYFVEFLRCSGKLLFPPEYPYKPPGVIMLTPSGRFKCNTRLCLSMSDFHPETWNPMWSVSTILIGLQSFMAEEHATTGSITSTLQTKRQCAADSLRFNCDDKYDNKLFANLN
jgi:ubiquitin-conjugating enzyme E2 J2